MDSTVLAANQEIDMSATQYANHYGYSDVNPFEVVRVVSDRTIEVREMDAELDPTWKPDWAVGGFAGHCVNQRDQRWNITSNAAYKTLRIRRNKDGVWKSADGRKFYLNDQPVRFSDYNF
jgi:hypothetical protein